MRRELGNKLWLTSLSPSRTTLSTIREFNALNTARRCLLRMFNQESEVKRALPPDLRGRGLLARILMNEWDKRIVGSHSIQRVVNDIIEDKNDEPGIIAVQTERRAGKDTAIISLIDKIATRHEKKCIFIVGANMNSTSIFRKNIRGCIPFDLENETSAKIAGKDVVLIFSSASSLAECRNGRSRGIGADIVIINDADVIEPEMLVNIVEMGSISHARVIMFGTNREDGVRKSAWLYYLNHPRTTVYKVLPGSIAKDPLYDESAVSISDLLGFSRRKTDPLQDHIKRHGPDTVSFFVGFP